MTITVHNLRGGQFYNKDTYAHSYNLDASPLAVPFGSVTGGMDVAAGYRVWLWAAIQRQDFAVCEELMCLKAMAAIDDLNLVCMCSQPKSYADVVKSCLEWMIREGIDWLAF